MASKTRCAKFCSQQTRVSKAIKCQKVDQTVSKSDLCPLHQQTKTCFGVFVWRHLFKFNSGSFRSLCTCLTFILRLIEKTTVLPAEEFYRLLKEEGAITLSEAQKTRIKKLFMNIKDNTLPYSTVLKCLDYSK